VIGGRGRPGQVKLAHSLWTVRRLAESDSEGYHYAASRNGFADITDQSSAGLAVQLSAAEKHPNRRQAVTSQEAISLAAVRAHRLLAEHHQPLTMTPGDVRRLLARYQRVLSELTEACQPYAPMEPDSEAETGPLPGQQPGPAEDRPPG
jgi:hypothetical protein